MAVLDGLYQVGGGTPVSEVCRNFSISEQTSYRGKKKFQKMDVAGMRWFRIREEKNCKLKLLFSLSFRRVAAPFD